MHVVHENILVRVPFSRCTQVHSHCRFLHVDVSVREGMQCRGGYDVSVRECIRQRMDVCACFQVRTSEEILVSHMPWHTLVCVPRCRHVLRTDVPEVHVFRRISSVLAVVNRVAATC